MTTAFIIVIGCTFIAVGRWLFVNPHKFAPSWSFGNTDSMRTFAKFFAIAMVFIGSFNLTEGFVRLLLSDLVGVLAAVVIAPVFTWTLLRRLGGQEKSEVPPS